jgi:hypothetical protein
MGAPVTADDMPDSIVPSDDLPDSTYNGLIPNADTAASSRTNLLGAAEVGGAAVGNMIPQAGNAVVDIGRRIAGADTAQPGPIPYIPVGQAGQQFMQTAKGALPQTPNGLDISDAELRDADTSGGKKSIETLRKEYAAERAKPLSQALGETGTVAGDIGSGLVGVGGDVASIAQGAGLVKGLASIGSRIAAAPDTALDFTGKPLVTPKSGEAPPPPTTAPTTTSAFTSADMRSKTPPEPPATPTAETGNAPVAAPSPAAPAPANADITHTYDPDTGEHVITSPNGESRGDTLQNGDTRIWRSETAPDAQGQGEGAARLAKAAEDAHARGANLVSSTSESPSDVRSYYALRQQGYTVDQNPNAEINPATHNLSLKPGTNPNESVFTVKPGATVQNAQAALDRTAGLVDLRTEEGAPPSGMADRRIKTRGEVVDEALQEGAKNARANPPTANYLRLDTEGAPPPTPEQQAKIDARNAQTAADAGRGTAPAAATGSRFTLPSEEGAQTTPHTPEEAGATAALIKKTLPQLNEVRTGALNNDRAASGQVFNQAKVKNAVGERARELIGRPPEHEAPHRRGICGRTGSGQAIPGEDGQFHRRDDSAARRADAASFHVCRRAAPLQGHASASEGAGSSR